MTRAAVWALLTVAALAVFPPVVLLVFVGWHCAHPDTPETGGLHAW